MYILKATREAILNHAAACYPRESCGLLVNREYVACENTHEDPLKFFRLSEKDRIHAELAGEIEAIVHSHPDGSSKPSVGDLIEMSRPFDLQKATGDDIWLKLAVPWVIVAYPEIDIAIHQPKPFIAPLINREYIHGALDCFSIVRDYYARELDIKIDNFDRLDRWWEDATNADLYVDNFASQGFVQVDNLQRHDVILCRVQPTAHVNHALIYLGDDGQLTSEQSEAVIGDHLVLHHPYRRRSRREIYGNVWQERSAIIVRHKSFL